MLGPRLGTVFASRWKALWWAAMVMATAYCTVPSAEEGQQSAIDQVAQQEAIKQLQALNLDNQNGAEPH